LVYRWYIHLNKNPNQQTPYINMMFYIIGIGLAFLMMLLIFSMAYVSKHADSSSEMAYLNEIYGNKTAVIAFDRMDYVNFLTSTGRDPKNHFYFPDEFNEYGVTFRSYLVTEDAHLHTNFNKRMNNLLENFLARKNR
jgi:hypothetical protein